MVDASMASPRPPIRSPTSSTTIAYVDSSPHGPRRPTRRPTRASTLSSLPNHIPSDGLLWIERGGAPPEVLYTNEPQPTSRQVYTPSELEKGEARTAYESSFSRGPEYGYVPKVYFEYAQRTLSTLIIAGTFMAGVEAQLLSLIFSANDETLKTVALAFAITALLTTSFVALYCAVTYIWLQPEWKHGPKRFQEWVAGSLSMMMIWCSTFLVVGVYAGFFAVVLFLFASAPHSIAVFSAVAFVLCGVGPMTWGFYYWYGLYRGYLEWVPDEEGSLPRRRRTG